jgi:predicted ATP-dependent endonuclease of OLD family
MYIQTLSIKNYRNFGETPFVIGLKPFTLLLGENNIGKTNLLSAVALLFSQDIGVFHRRILETDDFNYATVVSLRKQVANLAIEPQDVLFPEILIEAILADFDDDQAAVVGDWFADASLTTAKVSYRFALRATFDRSKWVREQRALLPQNQQAGSGGAKPPRGAGWEEVEFPVGEYRYTLFGGGVEGNECENHHLRMLRAEILDALRDARKELMAGGEQRLLYRVLRQGADTKYADLKQRLLDLDRCVEANPSLKQLKDDIRKLMDRVALQGETGTNSIGLRFSSPDASELLKKISMIYGEQPIDVARNGLGRNNLLYLALVMSQLARASTPTDNAYVCFRFVGIEEPEAHLHPHLQDHLARNIESIRQEQGRTMQLVMTSHSTHIASKLPLGNTAVIFQDVQTGLPKSHYVLHGLDEKKHEASIRFLSLYLDATKSRMFFARRLLLVEGISEQALVPRLFEIYSQGRKTLEGVGATVINVNGVAFRHFLTVVRNGYFRRCAVLTDRDSETQTQDRAVDLKEEFDTPQLIEVSISAEATFEKDLISVNRIGAGKLFLLEAFKDTKPNTGKKFAEATGDGEIDVAAFFDEIKACKAEFAFNLARRLDAPALPCGMQVPPYIATAFRVLE